jgi:hypothetical protein
MTQHELPQMQKRLRELEQRIAELASDDGEIV